MKIYLSFISFAVAQKIQPSRRTYGPWVSGYGECNVHLMKSYVGPVDKFQTMAIIVADDKRSGTVSSIPNKSHQYYCKATVRTKCENIAFRFTEEIDIKNDDHCDRAYVQVGTPMAAMTGKVCRLLNDYDYNDALYYGGEGGNGTDSSVNFFEWTELDGADITIAHLSGWYSSKSGFTLEYQCL